MSSQDLLLSLWRKLPFSPARKARLRSALLRRWPGLAPKAAETPGAPPQVPEGTEADAWQQLCRQAVRGTEPGRRDWIIFGIIGWDFRIQRPQHLARELARAGETVFYVEPLFVSDPRPGARVRQLDPDLPLYVVQLHLHGAPQIYFEPADTQQARQLHQSMAWLWAQWGIHAASAVVQHPYWAELALHLPNTLQAYDCMDHHEGFGGMPQGLVELEHAYMARADVVAVTSQWLHDWAAERGRPDAVVVRNGCDFEHFHFRPAEAVQGPERPRVIGYFGAIAQWFDVELVRRLALEFPDCEIVLVGDDTVQAGKDLAGLPNIRMTGERPYAELPQYLHRFDVCLLPFQRIPLTLATNPVKVYEYLCAGAEVVCTDLPEIAQFGDLVHKAGSHEAFVQAVRQALEAPADAAMRQRREDFARSQTWAERARALTAAVQAVELPSVSVVVLTYNNWAYTEACLRSLFTRTQYPGRLEVVVADNASSDETVERLKQWACEEPRLKLVLNERNLGFSAGNNAGLAAASGEYLVLLNNDTVVTRGWLLGLLRHFQADPRLGLLGPATNHIGNESKVPVHYETLDQMPAAARAWTLAHMGEVYRLRTLAFFCVMLPRAVYEQVGPMDETFGRGFFEDDDYCRRIEQAGLTLACADDVLVHHRLSASFDKVDSSERQMLFERNKAYYESKWGPWEPHGYRPAQGVQ
ncbi:glycosyltransferase [Melaminivora sp.]|uniref:glycosyltransferase n=1 Tax=Melaminivora sp. TaxID=1933032 RepID=UPI0028A9D2BB|nr:glycosyltransferase [Melaminivora sp.]